MYDYIVPSGVGDTFFVYAFVPTDNGITTGDAFLQSIAVQDGDFVARAWAGKDTVETTGVGPGAGLASIQIYDTLRHAYFSGPNSVSESYSNGQSIIPEKIYQDGGFIRFDLFNVNPLLNNTGGLGSPNVYADQLCFYGVRRSSKWISDPAPSAYKYYEKPYSIPFTFTLTSYGISTPGTGLPSPTQYIVPIEDFDFELREMRFVATDGTDGTQTQVPFAILLYNSSWRQTSNIPLHIERIAKPIAGPGTAISQQPYNPFPSPPLMYPINSVIRFNIYSMIPSGSTLPVNVSLLFNGVRRIPCQ